MSLIPSIRFSRLLFCCSLIAAVCVQGSPSGLIANSAADSGARASATASATVSDGGGSGGSGSVNADGYIAALKSTADVNNFLNGNTVRQQFLSNLTSRGVDPNSVNYIVVSSDSAGTGDGLTQLTATLNSDFVQPSGGSPLTGVEMWLGAYQHSDSSLESELLLVADAADGTQSLLTWVQADHNALIGTSSPISGTGDFLGATGSVSGAPSPGVVATSASSGTGSVDAAAVAVADRVTRFLICWITCYVIASMAYLLCIVQAIWDCLVALPPSLTCLAQRLALCRLAYLITIIILCPRYCLQVASAVMQDNIQPRVRAFRSVAAGQGGGDGSNQGRKLSYLKGANWGLEVRLG